MTVKTVLGRTRVCGKDDDDRRVFDFAAVRTEHRVHNLLTVGLVTEDHDRVRLRVEACGCTLKCVGGWEGAK